MRKRLVEIRARGRAGPSRRRVSELLRNRARALLQWERLQWRWRQAVVSCHPCPRLNSSNQGNWGPLLCKDMVWRELQGLAGVRALGTCAQQNHVRAWGKGLNKSSASPPGGSPRRNCPHAHWHRSKPCPGLSRARMFSSIENERHPLHDTVWTISQTRRWIKEAGYQYTDSTIPFV